MAHRSAARALYVLSSSEPSLFKAIAAAAVRPRFFSGPFELGRTMTVRIRVDVKVSRDNSVTYWPVLVANSWVTYSCTPCSSAAVAACSKACVEGKGVALETSVSRSTVMLSRKHENGSQKLKRPVTDRVCK